MRVLKEVYTKDDVEQRVSDTRNIISALEDSLYILISALEDVDEPQLSSKVREYINEVESISTNFYDDFEEYLNESPEEEDDVEDEVVDDEGFVVAESLSNKITGHSWQEFIQNIEKDTNFAVDSAFKRNPDQWIDLIDKDTHELYDAEVNKYFDGTYELMLYNITKKPIQEDLQQPEELIHKGFKIKFNSDSEQYDVFDEHDELIENGFKTVEDAKRAIDFDSYGLYECDEKSIIEDTTKLPNGKWVNQGDTGKTHGKFKTKKEADAQRKAMFANGFKEDLSERYTGEPDDFASNKHSYHDNPEDWESKLQRVKDLISKTTKLKISGSSPWGCIIREIDKDGNNLGVVEKIDFWASEEDFNNQLDDLSGIINKYS